MKIGFDARSTRQQSVGMKTYTAELHARLPRVAPEYDYTFFEDGANFGWDEQVRLPIEIARARVAAMHFPTLYVPVVLPPHSIVTIHDLIHLRFPEYFKAKVGPYYQTVVRWACARAARVITDDPRTVDDLGKFLGVDARKVRVVPLGVSERFFESANAPPAARPYFLYVGNHRRHKDLETLFEAWSRLPDELDVDLYVTGPDDFDGELERRRRVNREIRALGDLADDALVGYYAGARALVTAALCEGFGLPILEAMAAGCLVVACEDAVPAVLSPAAMTFAPRAVDELRAILQDVASDQGLGERFVKLGRQIARELTWDRCARATADVYAEVLQEAC